MLSKEEIEKRIAKVSSLLEEMSGLKHMLDAKDSEAWVILNGLGDIGQELIYDLQECDDAMAYEKLSCSMMNDEEDIIKECMNGRR